MRTVWKFSLGNAGHLHTVLAPSPTFIHAGDDGSGQRSIWLEVTPGAAHDEFHTVVVGTGFPLPDHPRIHLKSWVDAGGFVWHLYQLKHKFDYGGGRN